MRQLTLMICAAAMAAALLPAVEAAADDYYEWSTRRPFSGWIGGGRHSYYCDYIRYPVRDCRDRRVCHKGKCRIEEKCRVVDWDIRQTCY